MSEQNTPVEDTQVVKNEAPLGSPENPIQIDPNNVDENGNVIIPINFDELDFKSEEEWAKIHAEQEAQRQAEAEQQKAEELKAFLALDNDEKFIRLLNAFEELKHLIQNRLGTTHQVIQEFFSTDMGAMVVGEQLEKIMNGHRPNVEYAKAEHHEIRVHPEQTPGMYPTIWYAQDHAQEHLRDQVVVVRDDGMHPWLPDFAEKIKEKLSDTNWYCRDSICYVELTPKEMNVEAEPAE